MDHLILHKTTRAQLEQFASNPSQALLITGPTGIGKTAIAEALVERALAVNLASHPYHLVVRPDGATISIDAIRDLQKFLLLKTIGDKPLRRSIIIEHAHRLTTEAQNAFLKLLEEPPTDTLIILTADNPRNLLPTILSRTQTLVVNTPSEPQLQKLMSGSAKDEAAVRQAYFLSGGLPGLLSSLLKEEEHPLLTNVNLAKEALQKPLFERLAMVDAISKQKDTAMGVAEALERIAQAGLTGAGAKSDLKRVKQWHTVRKASLDAQHALRRSANAKLALTHLFASLG